MRGLRKSFGAARILSGIELEVPRGQAVALIGSNGAGKSTLLRCLLRLIEPSAGRVRILGREVGALSPRELRALRARVGFVFQKHNLVSRLSALSNVLHGAQARSASPRLWLQALARDGDRLEALRCLEKVGLAHLAERRADRLSGGQSQRVAIARALMQRPQIIFADEPVASLDPQAGTEVMEIFLELIRREGITLLFTSHSLAQALHYSDRVVGLRGGRIELDAPSASLNQEHLRGIYESVAATA
ncbi:phosphonate ABC transporter ATP-binding protein [Desulfovibrio sp. X2]|uniref:phosphonate ABC transporter ATP-binding protein n=1 Tax=Desulfovibrio sp. X2 TaxID=941449 RepID=UPI0004214025|nr:ATP-binding cassette domain-containing protein [Desulfovibrio sp. X2]